MQEEIKMSGIIQSYIYSMECSVQRMKWYTETGESRYLVDSETYLRAANVLIKEIELDDSSKSYEELVV